MIIDFEFWVCSLCLGSLNFWVSFLESLDVQVSNFLRFFQGFVMVYKDVVQEGKSLFKQGLRFVALRFLARV